MNEHVDYSGDLFELLEEEARLFEHQFIMSVHPYLPPEIMGFSTRNPDDWDMGVFAGEAPGVPCEAYLKHNASGAHVLVKIPNGEVVDVKEGVSHPDIPSLGA